MISLETLAAREEIKELRSRYFRCVDCKDWAAFEQLFVADAVLNLSDDIGRMLQGREAIARFVEAGLRGVVSVHHGHMPEIFVTSPSRANGIWAMEDRLFWAADSMSPVRTLHGYGHYYDTYVREDGRWLFESVTLRRIRVDTR